MIKRRTIGELHQLAEYHESTLSMDGKVVMGIDPGTNFMGYAIVKVIGLKPECLEVGVIRLNRIEDPYRKLSIIFQRVGAVIDRYKPSELALEAPFYGKNVQSMLKLGRAQGVAMAAGLSRGMDVFEYPPLRVKQSVTGVGSASKEQVAKLMEKIFSMDFSDQKLDATDALAVALCHIQTAQSRILSNQLPVKKRNYGGSASWENFVNKNSDKIIK